MVDIALADLIAVGDDSAVLVEEGTLHEVIVEVAEDSLDVVVLLELLVHIAVLVVAPAESCSRVVLGHTELNVVAGIVEAACNVDSAVTVGVEDILVFFHEFSREVSAALAGLFCDLVPFDHRNVSIVGMAASAP